jgi:hypothetical protein
VTVTAGGPFLQSRLHFQKIIVSIDGHYLAEEDIAIAA